MSVWVRGHARLRAAKAREGRAQHGLNFLCHACFSGALPGLLRCFFLIFKLFHPILELFLQLLVLDLGLVVGRESPRRGTTLVFALFPAVAVAAAVLWRSWP